MKSKNKSWKTTVVGIVGALCAIAMLIMVWIKIITMSDFSVGLASLSTFIGIIIALLAKDSDKTGLPQ